MTKEIQLTQGKVALVDDVDFEWLNKFKWSAYDNKRGRWYARNIKFPKTTYMHRMILNPSKDMQVDHINGDGLDNRRANLRECTNRQNIFNSKKPKANTTGYKGVTECNNKYRAGIRVNGKTKHLGYFTNPVDAAHAYDAAACKYFGEFAHLNFPD